MIRKSTLLAVAASAALGLAMLAPPAASAKHGGGGGGHGGGGTWMAATAAAGMRRRPRWPAVITSVTVTSSPALARSLSPPDLVRGSYRRYTVARPVAGPCTCLSKEYTPDGRVLFKDLCTNEAAINPPDRAAADSSIDAPVQQASNVQYQTAPANALPQVDPMTGQPK